MPGPADTMSPEVRAEYEAIVTELVLQRGRVVMNDPTEYGWADATLDVWKRDEGPGGERLYDGPFSHFTQCDAFAIGHLVEDVRWAHFVGTFNPGGPTEPRHGVEVHDVSCMCGRVKLRTVRWEGSIHDLAGAVFERLYRRLVERLTPPADETGEEV